MMRLLLFQQSTAQTVQSKGKESKAQSKYLSIKVPATGVVLLLSTLMYSHSRVYLSTTNDQPTNQPTNQI
jgi:hypothetical protein